MEDYHIGVDFSQFKKIDIGLKVWIMYKGDIVPAYPVTAEKDGIFHAGYKFPDKFSHKNMAILYDTPDGNRDVLAATAQILGSIPPRLGIKNIDRWFRKYLFGGEPRDVLSYIRAGWGVADKIITEKEPETVFLDEEQKWVEGTIASKCISYSKLIKEGNIEETTKEHYRQLRRIFFRLGDT